MKRRTKELLLAYALWIPGFSAYAGSLDAPWFDVITGLDGFNFLFERLRGGCFVWLAHPLVFVGWLFLVCRRWRAATAAGCLALVLALNAPFVFQPRAGPWFPAGPGYYLWFGSMVLLAGSAFVRGLFFRSDPVADNESFRRLAAQQSKFAVELAELRQQVADLVDHQAATFLEEA
jgi:hypothetical protein